MLSFYSPDDVSQAKKIIVQKYQSSLKSCSLLSDRRNSSSRPAQEAEVDDIIGIFDTLDLLGVLNGVLFVAANVDLLPKSGPEELNLAAVVGRQVCVDSAIRCLTTSVQQLATTQASSTSQSRDFSAQRAIQSATADMQQKLDSFATSVYARLDHLSAVCNTSLSSSSHQEKVAQQSDIIDRRLNIVLFGVPEDGDVSVWRHRVDDILHYITDHNVDVIDAFRLGRYNPSKARPILVKLRTAWDKRLILSRCSRLKQYSQRGIFATPDEPPEVRRKETYVRLKSRALNENKIVDEKDGVLIIDNVAIFSLSQGYVNRVNNDSGHG